MKKSFSISDRLKSFIYAGRGIGKLVGSEHNAWIHCIAIALVTCAGFYFHIRKGEWIAVLICFALVLAAEAFNTSIEKLVDIISPQRNPIAGDIKDISAGAVLICAIIATIAGAIIFIPYIV